jgi:DNA-directed RNA polymerase specialized sigma24 family protein
VSRIDELWVAACSGNQRALGDWMGRVERPIRRSLFPFAHAVDAEGVVQETLTRMWLYSRDRGHELTGDDASLRFAIGMARNLARNLARKHGREVLLPPDDMPEPGVEPESPPDPFIQRAIRECFRKLAGKPLAALQARLQFGAGQPDRAIAERVGMTVNTLLQNVVRARKQLAGCLEGKGINVEEYIR